MPRISDRKIRRSLSADFRRAQHLYGFGPARLYDLDTFLGHARCARTDARKDSAKHLKRLFSRAYAYVGVLSEMTFAMVIEDEELLPSDWVRSESLPNRGNDILKSNLSQLTNHALSVLSLIERGFANSARSLLRTLIEAAWLTIIFCGNRDKAQQYAMGTDFQTARKIWHRHFSPRSMMESLSGIERRLLGEDKKGSLQEIRQDTYEMHTQSTHNTCSVLQILSFDSDLTDHSKDPLMYPALHGRVGIAAKSTLEETIAVLFYTVLMLFGLLQTIHRHKASNNNRLWARSQTLAIGSLGLGLGKKTIKRLMKKWNEDPNEPGDDETVRKSG